MSAMSEMNIEANLALDLYMQYMQFEGEDIDNEDLRWQFIDAVVSLLEKLTDRKVEDELVY